MPFDGVVADLNVGLREGADRIDISDSYSSLGPEAMKLFVSSLRSGLERPVPLSMHTHNDFGLANASAIATACSGAYPDVAVNGISYRSGFASLEEVVVALELLCGVKNGIRLEKLQWLSDLVEQRTRMPPHPLKPVTGRHAHLRDHPM